MNRKLIILVAMILFIYSITTVLAFEEKITHPELTNMAVKKSGVEKYLTMHLGFSKGLDTLLSQPDRTETVLKWIERGSTEEDALSNCRASNHFHNPLKPWTESAMSDEPLWLDAGCAGWKPWYSNIVWGTGQNSPTAPVMPRNNQDMGWDKARTFFYSALTSKTSTDRETNFATTFQALGQLMHLLQDMAVPAHVRNDFESHLAFNNFTSLNPIKWYGNPFEYYVKTHPETISSLAGSLITANTPSFSRVTDYWDTTRYRSNQNPAQTVTNAGLAEYTNANYVSDTTFARQGTSVSDVHYFKYPDEKSSATQESVVIDDPAHPGTEVKTTRLYYRKTGDGETGHLLSAVDYLTYYAEAKGVDTAGWQRIAPMDDYVHENYAARLLPRAVGYSAGLLNYFFRGQLDLVKNDTGSSYTIVNKTAEDMDGLCEIYYEDFSNNRNQVWQGVCKLGAAGSSTDKSASISLDDSKAGKFILVFKGKLGNEEGAVIGKVITTGIYLVILPVNHTTREIMGKNYYSLNGTTLASITESNLPFSVLDDGGYWDQTTSTWTSGDANGLRVPLGTGGPQYIAKYQDGTRVRFIANGSYEKEAYHAFTSAPKSPGTSQIIKSFNYVTFVGSPLLGNGSYDENTGWMEYTANGLFAIVPPASQNPRTQRFFSASTTLNFSDTFIEAPSFKFYGFNSATYEAAVPREPEAPKASILSAYKPDGVDYVNVTIPSVYNTYVRPIPFWTPAPALASSGLDHYRFTSTTEPVFDSHENKCTAENNDCGNISQGATAILGVYDIPHNYNSKVRVHNNDGGNYYEELYINGALVETSAISTQKLETHYQILAVHKDTAVVRKTTYVSSGETPLAYRYSASAYRIYEKYWNFTSTYAIYLHGVRYDLAGTTAVKSRYLSTPYDETSGTTSPVNYLTYEIAEDIKGYHLDRIFISETFDRSNILVAFDEYAYNNDAGFVHDLKYEQSNLNDGKYILYHDMPATKLQNADHEATRTGRKLLLFKSDGTLKAQLQDPVGLSYTIGSIGILN